MVLAIALIRWTPSSSALGNNLVLGSGGPPTVTGAIAGTQASTDSALGNTLTANLFFGDVSPANTNSQVKIVMPIYISAKRNYNISVQCTIIPATSGVQATDIGFGVSGVTAVVPGSTQLTANATSIVVSSPFNNDPSTATLNGNGQPQFASTMNNVSTTTPTLLFSGPVTVTNGGGLGDIHTAIQVNLIFVIVPQFFNKTASFSTVLTVTMTQQ